MTRRLRLPLIAAALAVASSLAGPARAAVSDAVIEGPVEARLVTAEDGVAPGAATLSAGLQLTLEEGWKTYWRSPGEVGTPPEVAWDGSENVEAVELLWPAPTRFRAFGIENFGYADEVVFPLRVTLAEPGAPAALRAAVSLLVCSDICVPLDLALALDLLSGAGVDAASGALIAEAAARVPDAEAAGLAAGVAHLDAGAATLTVTARSDRPLTAPDVFPELDGVAFGAPDIRLGEGGRTLWAELPILAAGDDAAGLRLTVTDGGRAGTLETPLVATPLSPPFALERIVPGAGELAWIALLALMGGLVLNAMPCVLPVLSIKLSSAMHAHAQEPARVRRGFLVSALGVLAFMWTLAAATILARALGVTVGWGLQFQNPVFLAAMIALLGLFAANMLGLYEIALPQSWTTALARGEARGGYGGDLATGAFAAILATPCSAPFLGTAVAFALAGRALDVAVVFTALGLGLAAPYLAVAVRPSLVRAMPRPGRWMVAAKAVLGLLLLLTAGWLVWVLVGVAGGRVAGLVVAALALALVLLWQAPRLPRAALGVALAGALAGALAAPAAIAPGSREMAEGPGATAWRPFDRAAIASLVSTGEVVFVDVTADWCLTCKANKALVLDRGEVAAALAGDAVTPMRADWTRPDPAISRYLEANGRFGIPFNAVYGPGTPDGIVLPELLSSAAVLDALDAAGRRTVAEGG